MKSNQIPAKDRLQEKLLASEALLVKQALYGYLAQADPQLADTTFDKVPLESLLPIMANLSPLWESMTAADFLTSYPMINNIYHLVRNAFRYPDSLKKHIKEYLEEQEGFDDITISEQHEPPMQTRGQTKSSPPTQKASKNLRNSKENTSTKQQKFEVQKQPKIEEHEVIPPRNPSPQRQQLGFEENQVSAPQLNIETLTLSIFRKKRDIKILEKQVTKLLKLDQQITEQLQETD